MKSNSIFSKLNILVITMLSLSTLVVAQIPNGSPFHVDFIYTDETGNESAFEYSSMVDFGINLTQTVSGELQWARDDGAFDGDGDGSPDENYVDSLNCSWNTTQPMDGKIALVRRGACFFSQKIYNAQQAGAVGVIICSNDTFDPDEVIGMAGADSMGAVVIPAIYISYNSCETVRQGLDNGEITFGTFSVNSMSSANAAYAFATPLNHVRPLEDIQVTFVNNVTTSTLLNTSFTVEIIAPNGVVTNLNEVVEEIAFDEIRIIDFETYVPNEIGVYTTTYTNSVNDEVVQQNFEITENTFQMDNGVIDGRYCCTADARVDMGNFFLSGPNGGLATQASFAVQNYDNFQLIGFKASLYDCDPDGDGIGPDGAETNYSSFEEIGNAIYEVTGNEQPNEVVFATFNNPITLKPNGQYLLMVKGDTTNFLSETPLFAYAGQEQYPSFSTVIFLGTQLNMIGVVGNNHALVRLHTDPTAVSVVDQSLAPNKINVSPIPTNDFLNLDLNLDETADEVQIEIIDIMGRSILNRVLNNVKNEVTPIDVNQLSTGTYFMSVITPEGFRSVKFTVAQ